MTKNTISIASILFLVTLWALIFPTDAVAQGEKLDPYFASAKSARYYGLYFQGHKVGWMSMERRGVKNGLIELVSDSEFALNVGGRTTEMASREIRRFDPEQGFLVSLHFEMKGTTGETRIEGKVENGMMLLHSFSGGSNNRQSTPYKLERIQDSLGIERLIAAGQAKSGITQSFHSFDPSIRSSITTEHRVGPTVARSFRGITQQVVRVDSKIKQLSMPMVSWYDTDGELVETLLAGFLKARWEDEAQAKGGFSMADFIETGMLPSPKALRKPESAKGMSIVLSGVPEELANDSARQRWSKLEDGRRRLHVELESFDEARSISIGKIDRTAHASWIAPTPRIQSDDPAIVETALKLKGKSNNSAKVAKSILGWVYKNVMKRYTPTFSNASETMKSMQGDCGEHAVLFVALARAAGIPAREVTGIVYSERMGGFGFHAWAEVWLGRWVAVDPSWGQFPPDPTHIAFAAGGMEQQVRIVSLIGSLNIHDIGLQH